MSKLLLLFRQEEFRMIKKRKGITLVELLIVIAIMSLVLSGVYSLYGFGNKTYKNGSNQYDIQSRIRLAGDYIKKQVMYATDIKIISESDLNTAIAAGIKPYENYIYFNSTDNTITHMNCFFKKNMSVGNLEEFRFEFNNSIAPPSPPIPPKELRFIMTGREGDKKYTISPEIYCLNVHLSSDIAGDSREKVLYFKTPNDHIAEQIRPGKLDGINTVNEFTIKFDKDYYNNDISVDLANIISYYYVDNVSIIKTGARNEYVKVSIGSINTVNSTDIPRVIFSVKYFIVSDPTCTMEFNYVAELDKDNNIWSIK